MEEQKTTNSGHKYAGGWSRFLAYIIDAILIGLAMQIITATGVGYTSGQYLTSIGALAYLIIMIALKQQTVGMMALKLKIVSENKETNWWATAVLRELVGRFVCGITLGIGYLIIFWTGKKQGLHDMIAKTVVVKED